MWTASLMGRASARYGQFVVSVGPGKSRHLYAHRIAWELTHGHPGAMSVLHRCDVPRCVNPAHLFLGTQDDNLKDCARKGRFSVPRPNHPRRKLTEPQVEEIRNLHRAGMRQVDIAARFDVTRACISTIVNGKRRVYTAPQLRAPRRKVA